MARQLHNGILLVDGALTLRTYNTPQVFLERLGREAANRNSDLVGISKKSRVTVGGVHMSALLDEDPSDAGYRRILTLDAEGSESDATLRNLGTPFAARFPPNSLRVHALLRHVRSCEARRRVRLRASLSCLGAGSSVPYAIAIILADEFDLLVNTELGRLAHHSARCISMWHHNISC
jgi:hypothetical protein